MLRRLLATLALLAALPALAQSSCAPDGIQASGSIYRICMPTGTWNGSLVLWAHGFQDAGTPVSIPQDQLCAGGLCIPTMVNDLGFAFATNSYSKTGLAVVQGQADLLDLVSIFTAQHGKPTRVYMVGASEGGIITTLSLEKRPDVFSAGVAACGPIGDFPAQIAYFGDARATFEYFFPGLIPGSPFAPSAELIQNWGTFYQTVVEPTILQPANLPRLGEWAMVAHLPFDTIDLLGTLRISARDALRYSVVNLNDAAATLGGMPYGNIGRVYSGSSNDAALNAAVPRIAASPAAVAEMAAHYTTSGVLPRPLITMHTLLDQQVPVWHEVLYAQKTAASGAWQHRHFLLLGNAPYGHCSFNALEMLYAFLDALYLDAATP